MPDFVVFLGFNYYAASVIPGELYKISITGLDDDADLFVYGTDSTFTFLESCSIDNTGLFATDPEDCVISADGNTLYFGVDGTFLSASTGIYTITIEMLTITNQNLSAPFSDIIAREEAGVYAVSLTPGLIYTVSITGLTGDADLYVFGNDNTFSTPAACSTDNTFFAGTTPEDCTLTSGSNTLYFIVDGLFSSTAMVTYTALVTLAPVIINPVNEGSIGAPVPVTAGTPKINGQVGVFGISYYVASSLTPGASYTVSMTGLTNNANLAVFSNNTFTTLANCIIDNTYFTGTTPEDCTLFTTSGTLYFAVSAGPNRSAYIILVKPGP